VSARIAIDARKLADFGIGSYLRGLISGLAAIDDDRRYLLLAPAGAAALLPNLPARFEWVEEDAPHYSRAELFAISRQVRRLGADLLHCPHYVVPFAPPCPVVVTIHDAIHLTHPETLPRPRAFAYGYAKLMLGRAVRIAERVIAVSQAAAAELESELRIAPGKLVVVANGVDEIFHPRRPSPPSNPLADTATAVLFPAGDDPLRQEKKKPIEGDASGAPSPSRGGEADSASDRLQAPSPAEETGVFRASGASTRDPGYRATPPPPEPSPATCEPSPPLLRSFSPAGAPPVAEVPAGDSGLRPGPLLFVGNPKQHKNLHRLIEAYARLVRARGKGAVPPLLLAGGGCDDREEAALRARSRRLGIADRVHYLGYVTAGELVDLYRSASMLVFPTLVEGFGLPIAEAMACGTPVVVSDRPVHREIAGEAGERVDPLDPASIAAGIARLLDDPALAARRAEAGGRLAARFSWRTAAAATAGVYAEALAVGRRGRTRGPA